MSFVDDIGGETAVRDMLGTFHGRLKSDESIAGHLDAAQMSALTDQQSACLCAFIDGETDDAGNAMADAHAYMLGNGLTDDGFDRGWIPLEMNDDGTEGDLHAGDNFWSVTIPASVQRNRSLIRYRIRVEDGAGNGVLVPYADDPQPNFAYYCYDGVPSWSGASVTPSV